VHVRGRVGDVHGFVASGDAGEDVDLAADFRADEGALVGASPRQAHDVDAAAHRPRARAGGQADVSGQDDARDAVFRHGGGGQRAGRVDEDAARFDMDAHAIAADVKDAVGFAGGFVAGPGVPRVDADAGECFLLVNVLGRQVGEARTRIDGRGRDGVDGAGQAQVRESRTGHEARVGDADGGSREVVVAVVVVVDESPAECVVSCARVVVGAVGPFCGESPFKGFAHRFGQERPGDGGGRCDRVRVKCGDAWRRPVVGGEDTELLVGEASRRGGVRSGGVGVYCEESASGASEGFGVSASLRDEVVASVVIVCPSSQQPSSYPTSVKCCD